MAVGIVPMVVLVLVCGRLEVSNYRFFNTIGRVKFIKSNSNLSIKFLNHPNRRCYLVMMALPMPVVVVVLKRFD